ncbi:hypothetical protein K0M31_016365, partial [Melipona bicolor]
TENEYTYRGSIVKTFSRNKLGKWVKNGDSRDRGCYKLATYVFPDNSAGITLSHERVRQFWPSSDGCAIRSRVPRCFPHRERDPS